MALRFHIFPAKPFQQFARFQSKPYPSTAHLLIIASPKLQFSISCNKDNSFSDGELALEFAAEVGKMNAQMLQREEALNKSRELLFIELGNYTGLEAEELKKKWRKMNDDDKWVLVKDFVSEWGANFHPLSAKSVKDLVDEYLVHEKQASGGSASMLLPSLKRLMGCSQNH